jgi:Concanavalin A-like lectin/glucanases superfamily
VTQDISYFETGYIDETYFTRIADAAAELKVASSLHAQPFTPTQAANTQAFRADLTVTSSITRAVLDKVTRASAGYIVTGGNYSGIGYDSTIKKFGTSLRFDARSAGARVDLGPVYADSKFLAITDNFSGTNYTITSRDGITWTTTANNLPIQGNFLWLKYLNNKWITAIGAVYYSSTDGITWTSTAGNVGFSDITYNGTYYIGITGVTSYNSFAYSTNLSTWTGSANILYTSQERAIKSFAINYFNTNGDPTLGYLNITAGRSYDGSTALGPTINYFVSRRITTPGVIGTQRSKTVSGYPISNATYQQLQQSFLDAASDGTNIVLVGTSGIIYTVSVDNLIATSANSTNINSYSLTARTSGTTEDIVQIEYLNNNFVARTSSGKVLSSSAGSSWTVFTPSADTIYDTFNNAYYVKSIAYGASTWIAGKYSSADLSAWTAIDFAGQLPNQQPNVYYNPVTSLNTWKTIDFWVYISSASVYGNGGIFYSNKLNIWFDVANGTQTNANVYLYGFDDGNGPSTGVNNPQVEYNTWNHFRIVIDGESGSYYKNGSRVGTFTPGTRTTNNGPMLVGRTGNDIRTARPAYYIDEVLITKDLLTSPSAASFSVPTEPWSNTANTLALLHFNNTIADDNAFANSAQLTSTSSITALVGKRLTAQAQLASTTTLTAQALGGKQLLANLTSRSSISAVARKTARAQSNLSSTTTLVGVDQATDHAQANLSSTATLTAAVRRIRTANVSLTSTSQISANCSRLRLVTAVANISSQATVSANAVKTARVARALNSITSLTARLDRQNTVRLATANLYSTSQLTATAGSQHIDTSLVWIVEAEDRDWKIAYEYRDWTIPSEV